MLNPKKVELNTRLLVYEQGAGKEALRLRNIYDGKGSFRNLFANILCGIISYAGILALVYCAVGYRIVNFPENFFVSVLIIIAAVIAGIIYTSLYCHIIFRMGEKRYKDVRNSIGKYDLTRKQAARE